MNGLMPTIRNVMAMPARGSKTKSATRKTAARKTTVAARRPAARKKPAAKKATTRRKTAARKKPAAKTSEQLGAPLPSPEPIMPVADPSLIREEATPQPASPCRRWRRLRSGDSPWASRSARRNPRRTRSRARVASMKAVPPREDRLVLEAIGVNQSLPEGVSSPSEAIHAASAHMHVKYPAGLGPARVGTALTIC